ncbi:hypothetical protein BIZ71_gp34 [Gordonia phage Hedwig]|uniref:Uncharacterized protein n=1 Tax=Gordonia phage Hedwig TaxID=1887648 RepID=A0A1C9EHT4_9CAUD|nr:hypothetical protein BIZ71_gp34 [Gordonia phage Hedwig]AON97327.1 hypothetical protein SEA_HEDWIG_34 [Gordonia phage Hedwig]
MLPIMMTHAHHGALAQIRLMVSISLTLPYPEVWCTRDRRNSEPDHIAAPPIT